MAVGTWVMNPGAELPPDPANVQMIGIVSVAPAPNVNAETFVYVGMTPCELATVDEKKAVPGA
jgi:hypothetical protein